MSHLEMKPEVGPCWLRSDIRATLSPWCVSGMLSMMKTIISPHKGSLTPSSSEVGLKPWERSLVYNHYFLSGLRGHWGQPSHCSNSVGTVYFLVCENSIPGTPTPARSMVSTRIVPPEFDVLSWEKPNNGVSPPLAHTLKDSYVSVISPEIPSTMLSLCSAQWHHRVNYLRRLVWALCLWLTCSHF